MSSLSKFPDGTFFDADYFERGRETGKSFYSHYRWLPIRSFREALAIVDALGLNEKSLILDVGCAKGFLVRALRMLEIRADGCDISEYALSCADGACFWKSDTTEAWERRKGIYTHAYLRDVLEHGTHEQILETLRFIRLVAPVLMCVIPMGDSGLYRIQEYHLDKSHVTAENEAWWRRVFAEAGWRITREEEHIPGIKDNWRFHPYGNRVFFLEVA
ncbi:MAG: hypothetical protein WC436_06200 [Candidatus Babeliales bacterium]